MLSKSGQNITNIHGNSQTFGTTCKGEAELSSFHHSFNAASLRGKAAYNITEQLHACSNGDLDESGFYHVSSDRSDTKHKILAISFGELF